MGSGETRPPVFVFSPESRIQTRTTRPVSKARPEKLVDPCSGAEYWTRPWGLTTCLWTPCPRGLARWFPQLMCLQADVGSKSDCTRVLDYPNAVTTGR